MGLQERKQKTKLRILEAAEQLFRTQGFAKTTMNDVAQHCELGVGTLYNYYRSKTELLIAIFREKVVAFPLHELLEQSAEWDTAVKINRIIDVVVSPFLDHDRSLLRESVAVAMGFAGQVDSITPSAVLADEQLFQILRQVIAQEVAIGKLPLDFPIEVAIRNIHANAIALVMFYMTDETMTKDVLLAQLHQQVEFVLR